MSLFMQALLVAIFVTIAFIDAHTTQIHIFRPIVVGPVVGLIMGDVQTGFQVGVTVELMFLAVIFVGTAVPPNPTISTAIATGIAILAGGGTDIAVATALPVSFIGQVAETVQNSVINVFFMHRVEKATEKLDTRGIVLNNLVFPMAGKHFSMVYLHFLQFILEQLMCRELLMRFHHRSSLDCL